MRPGLPGVVRGVVGVPMMHPVLFPRVPRAHRDPPSPADLAASELARLRSGGAEEWSGLIAWARAETERLRETRLDAEVGGLIARRALERSEHPREESRWRSVTRNGRVVVERPRTYRRLRGLEWRRLREALERIYDERTRFGQ